ncbi:MAG TPA: GDSL-type esterase/lipase family protein [Chitinophagaceae bacterium]|nr:GDSL-type esterase/lipase family protein [Chitinophagaceae bacterium]
MKKNILILLLVFCFQQKAFLQNVKNSKLHFTSNGKSRVSLDSIYYYQCAAMDSSGNQISFSVEALPSWLKFNKENHSVSGKPLRPGQYMIHLLASAADTIDHQNFMLTVFNNKTMNILAIGNSITNGTNKYNSYRRPLWQLLHNANYNFDFIGSWNKHHMGGEVPNPDFDMDHDGHSGWTTHDMLSPPDWDKQRGNINTWLQAYRPDIVLVELGTNDVFQCVPAKAAMENIDSILNILRNKNPQVKIFLAQIPPLGAQWAEKKLCGTDISYGKSIEIFNNQITKLAAEKNTIVSPVIAVDLFTNVNPATDMYDDIHPNDIGEWNMAESWYKAIKKYLGKLKIESFKVMNN